MSEIVEVTSQHYTSIHISIRCSFEARNALLALWFENVRREARKSYWYEDMNPGAIRWDCLALKAITKGNMNWNSAAKTDEEAVALAKAMLDQFEKESENGTVLNFPQRIIMGRKPSWRKVGMLHPFYYRPLETGGILEHNYAYLQILPENCFFALCACSVKRWSSISWSKDSSVCSNEEFTVELHLPNQSYFNSTSAPSAPSAFKLRNLYMQKPPLLHAFFSNNQ